MNNTIEDFLDRFEQRNGKTSFKREYIGQKGDDRDDIYSDLSEIVHTSNTDEDTAYDTVHGVLEAIRDGDIRNRGGHVVQWASSAVGYYNSELIEWLQDGYNREATDDVIDTMDVDGIIHATRIAQEDIRARIARRVIDLLNQYGIELDA